VKPNVEQVLAAMPARQLNLLACGAVLIAAALAWTLAIRAPLAALRLQRAQLASLQAASPAPATGPAQAPPTAVAPLPPAPAPLDLIAAVGNGARETGLIVASAVPGAEGIVAGMRQHTLQVDASGGYGAIVHWLAATEAEQPAVGILRVELRAAPEGSARHAQVQFAAYGTEAKR
jgi:hypothetical protein